MNTGTLNTDADSGGPSNRRGTGRYPVREDVRYRVVQSRTVKVSGVGSTLNIGSGGILFTTEEKLSVGQMVELSVNWPGMLGGVWALHFFAKAAVARSEALSPAVGLVI